MQLSAGFSKAILVHNTRQEIENCADKLQLKLLRIWGGDEEEDERKFFKTPVDIAVSANGVVYICDMGNNKVFAFDSSGKFQRAIGRKGKGPGDLFFPKAIAIDETGNLVVCEDFGRRIQILTPTGKYLNSYKLKKFSNDIDVLTSKRIVVYSPPKTFESRKLLSIYNYKDKSK